MAPSAISAAGACSQLEWLLSMVSSHTKAAQVLSMAEHGDSMRRQYLAYERVIDTAQCQQYVLPEQPAPRDRPNNIDDTSREG
jgi:hypothetical protein